MVTEASTDRLLEVAAAAFDAAIRRIGERDREIQVLTLERDNALLRIEELERTHTDKWDRFDEHRGGVNPNA